MQATTPTSSSKPRIRYLGGTRYLIESKSQPGIGRQVDTLTLRCSCPAGQFGRRCHHLVTALAYEDWRKRQQVQARAGKGASAPVPPAPAPVPHAPAATGDWHESAAYLGLAAAFGE